MIFNKNKKETPKDICSMITFLLYKWQQVLKLSALEKISHIDKLYVLQKLGSIGVDKDVFNKIKPSKRLAKIKGVIVDLLPGSDFIILDYDPGMDLGPEDFVELFINHECILMEKIIVLLRGRVSNE